MKRNVTYRLCCMIISVLGYAYGVMAQEVVRHDSLSQTFPVDPDGIPEVHEASLYSQSYTGMPKPDKGNVLAADSMPSQPLFVFPPLQADRTIGIFPDTYYGLGSGVWNLHEGFNANLNMSVCASFGKHRFPGVGFGTGISAMYAHRLTDRLMMAAGGFYDRISWGVLNENRVGLNMMLGYQLTEKVSIYAYGSKVFTPSSGRMHMMPPMFWMDRYKGRFGGMVHVKVSDAMSFSVSVEERFR